MTRVINIQHWLDENGEPARPVRRQALRVARLIEYGGPLEVGHARATLVECSRRVERRPCEGLLWVLKKETGTIDAFCVSCRREHLQIWGWELTEWAAGPMEPLSPEEQEAPAPEDQESPPLN